MRRTLPQLAFEFIFLAIWFGGFMYLGGWLGIDRTSVWSAVISGVLFASLMTAFHAIRKWRRRRTSTRFANLS